MYFSLIIPVFNRPEEIKELYLTSPEISPESHVGMQAAFQEHCDSGISKTINFANDATIEDVYTTYMLAWKTKCKGIFKKHEILLNLYS